MDALSILGGAFTVLQVLQQLVELAQKLHQSLGKAKKAMKTTKQIALQILESVTQLKTFYEQHSAALAEIPEFSLSVKSLKGELQTAYKRCDALFVIPASGPFGKSKTMLNTWLRREKVEGEISEIKSHVQACYIRFTALASVHTTTNTHTLLKAVSRIEEGTKDIGKVALSLSERQLHELQEIKLSLANCSPVDQTLAEQATSSLANPTSHVGHNLLAPEHLVAEMFVRQKVNHIEKSLALVSTPTLPTIIEFNPEYNHAPFKPVIILQQNEPDRTVHYDEAVQKTLDIIRIVQSPNRATSIQQGAWKMVSLISQLHHLNMYPEAVSVGTWTVDLFRTLAQWNADIYTPYLSFSLFNLTCNLIAVGDVINAENSIAESVRLAREAQLRLQTKELRGYLGRVLVLSSTLAQSRGDVERALRDAEEAVQLYESIGEEFDHLDASSPSTAEERPPNLDPRDAHSPRQRMDESYKRTLEHASALHRLSFCFAAQHRWEESYDSEIVAFAKFHQVHDLYPGNFLDVLGEAAYFLCLPVFRHRVSIEVALEYACEATRCNQLLAQRSPSRTIWIRYYHSLWERASLLEALGQHDDALKTWEETLELSREFIRDPIFIAHASRQVSSVLQQLSRHDEALITLHESIRHYRSTAADTTENEADTLHDLSILFSLLRRFREAAKAQQEAVDLYRYLFMKNPSIYSSEKLAGALTQLSNCLISLSEFDRALEDGDRALDIYKEMELSPDIASNYVYAIEAVLAASLLVADSEKAIAHSLKCSMLLETLFEHFPAITRDALADALAQHVFNLSQHGRTNESVSWAESHLQWFEKQSLGEAPHVARLYHNVLVALSDELCNMGQINKALRYNDKAIRVGREYCANHTSTGPQAINSTALFNRTENLLYLGRYEEAERAGREAVNYIKLCLVNNDQFAGALSIYATTLARLGRLDEAIVVARQALDVCRVVDFDKAARENIFAPLQLPHSLYTLAELLADDGDVISAIEHAQEAYDALSRIKESSSIPWPFVEVTYGACELTLATTLLLGGRISQAIVHLESLSQAYSSRLQIRPGHYIRYITVLRLLSWSHCADGEHDKGLRVAEELERTRKALKMAFCEVSELTDIGFSKEGRRAVTQAIWARLNITCGHHYPIR